MKRSALYLYKNNPYQTKKRKLCNYVVLDNESDNENDFDGDFLFNTSVSHEDNRIYFKSKVSDESVDKLIKIITTKNKEFNKLKNNKMIKHAEPKPLYLHITSYGGDLLASFRAVDAIKRSKVPIYTVVDGYAASGATLMSIVGRKRFMTPNSYMLIHQLSSGAIGKFWEIKDDYQNCANWMEDIYNLYLEHSGMELDELKSFLTHDVWWKADQCIETGLVDKIYDNDN